MNRKEADQILAILNLALGALDEVGHLRVEVSMARTRLLTFIADHDADLTPTKPLSVSAMAAYKTSSEFKKPKL